MSNTRKTSGAGRKVTAGRIVALSHGPDSEAARLCHQLVDAAHTGDHGAVGRLAAAATQDRALAVGVIHLLATALASLAGPGSATGS